ncbi:hypothetical protein WI40_31945 [Burkholderia ubonensis]|uniref:hypothetical protein n=1 Tax=Burkholderia ubonensis TaxID=101571 RepID=UPI00076C1605|nr:hypothetical protein [Burkholderia ubonensis]KUZ86105.1 hypothetical protein WI40_31945 [Burkholderia ubonensis]
MVMLPKRSSWRSGAVSSPWRLMLHAFIACSLLAMLLALEASASAAQSVNAGILRVAASVPAAQASGTDVKTASGGSAPQSAGQPGHDGAPTAAPQATSASDVLRYVGALIAIVVAAIVALALLWAAWQVANDIVKGAPGDGFAFRRHWGGFGGAGAGWSMSMPLVQLLVAVALVLLAAVIVLQLLGNTIASQGPVADGAKAGEKPAGSGASAETKKSS